MTVLQLAAVLLCVLFLSDVGTSMPGTKCCTQLGDHVTKVLLKKVKSYKIQKQDGTCHLQAVLLHVQHKILCINPENKLVQQWIKRQEQKSSGHQEPRKNHPVRKNPKNKKKILKEEK